MPDLLDSGAYAYLRRQLSMGEIILFTGAGFSAGCHSLTGMPVPVGTELRNLIWPHAFPTMPFNDTDTLADIFAVALRQDPSGLKTTLEAALRIDPKTIPAWYRRFMSGPWFRVYTLNFDDFWELAPRIDPDARSLTPVSATTDETLPPDSTSTVVHLNGRLSDYPNVTVSAQQYGHRSAGPEKWYEQLVADMYGHPVLFLGTELNEPPLWQYMALRQRKPGHSGDRRPQSFLISPSLGPSKAQLLSEFNIVHINATAAQFSDSLLEAMSEESKRGRDLLAERRSRPTSDRIIEDVSTLRAAPPPPRYDPADYLKGRQPQWPDLTAAVIARRDFDDILLHSITTAVDPRLIVVTGTAGTGKSTALMVAAAALQQDARRVLWFDAGEQTELHLWQLRHRVKDADAEYLFIDEADAFGAKSGEFLEDLLTTCPDLIVVASCRANRLRSARLEREDVSAVELTVPGLADTDIDAIIGCLDAANRLGFLKGKSRNEQREVFARSFDRQLLVAMLQATTGKAFADIIKEECEELVGVAFDVYAMTCLLTTMGFGIRREELVLAVGTDRESTIPELNRLLDRRLLITDGKGLVKARHRVIAEQAIDFVVASGHLPSLIEGLTYAFATKAGPEHGQRSRERKILARLINHDFLIERVRDPAKIRPIYSQIENILNWDYHFWLQRGSFEVERGSVNDAENFLAQAMSLTEHDLYVRTEWGYMLLVKATGEAKAGIPANRDHAEEGFAELRNVISVHGSDTPYPFHVLARQGCEWLASADLSPSDRLKELERIRWDIRVGIKSHPHSIELRTIRDDVERAYLRSSLGSGTFVGEVEQ